MTGPAPLWVCFLPQLVSVTGDSFGQRSSRVYHHGSRRRFILGLVCVSCIQMFVGLTIVQLAFPSTATIVYTKKNHTTIDYCSEPENAHSVHCYAQGPLTIYRAVADCPLLLLDGVLNIFYYLGEASMYREPLGVLMLVLAALTSSFIIAPMQNWFNLSGAQAVSVWAILLGLAGAAACLVERTPKGHADDDERSLQSDSPPAQQHAANDVDDDVDSKILKTSFARTSRCSRVTTQMLRHLPLLGPFLMLAFTYAIYFVIMLFYNDDCKINMWGYNAFDQVALPPYIFIMFLIVDLIPPLRNAFAGTEDVRETYVESMKHCAAELFSNRGAGFLNMFVYRLLINARAVAYTYIAVRYDLSSSYLELTLIRVVLSWMASLLLVMVVPSFILAEEIEQRKLKDRVNIGLKVAGTVAIVGSLLIIHYEN